MYKMLSLVIAHDKGLVRTPDKESHDWRHYETLDDADKAKHEWVHTLQVLRSLDIISDYIVRIYNGEGDCIACTKSQPNV